MGQMTLSVNLKNGVIAILQGKTAEVWSNQEKIYEGDIAELTTQYPDIFSQLLETGAIKPC
jgi:hypothetical protein